MWPSTSRNIGLLTQIYYILCQLVVCSGKSWLRNYTKAYCLKIRIDIDSAYVISCRVYSTSWHDNIQYIVAALVRMCMYIGRMIDQCINWDCYYKRPTKELFFDYVVLVHKIHWCVRMLTTDVHCLSHCLVVSSLGTHCTSQFSLSCVWRACNPMTFGFHVVEQSSILTCSSSRDSLRHIQTYCDGVYNVHPSGSHCTLVSRRWGRRSFLVSSALFPWW